MKEKEKLQLAKSRIIKKDYSTLKRIDFGEAQESTYTILPIIMAGTAMPATNPIPTGAPTSVPNCHISFFFCDQGFVPQNVHPEGLQ